MTQDLEASILRFLKETPRKRFITVREIALAVTGKYPAARQEKYVREICLSLWEFHLLDEKTMRKPYYRLKQAGRMNAANRAVLGEKYKEHAIEILAKNRDYWMLRSTVIAQIVGPDIKQHDARMYLAQKSISKLTKLGIVDAKNHGDNMLIKLR